MKRAHSRAHSRALARARPRARVVSVLLATGLLSTGLLSACGGNVTSGGFGEIEVLLSSETSDELLGAARVLVSTNATGSMGNVVATGAGPLVGTLSVTVRSFVREGGSRWIEVTHGPQEIIVPLEDPTPVVVARAQLASGEYEAVRTLFGRIRVHVERGLEVNGVPVVGEFRVEVGTDGILVMEERGVRVERQEILPLLLEMRVRRWLPLVDQERRVVEGPDFRREFRIRTLTGR